MSTRDYNQRGIDKSSNGSTKGHSKPGPAAVQAPPPPRPTPPSGKK